MNLSFISFEIRYGTQGSFGCKRIETMKISTDKDDCGGLDWSSNIKSLDVVG